MTLRRRGPTKAGLLLRWHREAPDLGSDAWILGCQHIRVTELDIRRLDAEPFCRGAEKPPPPADYARGVEWAAWDIQLHPMALAQIGADDVTFGRPVFRQHQYFDRIAKIVMIELIVTDAVKLHRLFRRQHEVKRRSSRPSVGKRGLQSASRNFVLADEGDADITAGRIWSEVKELAHILKCHVIDHVRRSSGDGHGLAGLGGRRTGAQHCRRQ